jgi:hypothetical protein
MRRPAKGGTNRPGLARPGNGYGRPLRPRPSRHVAARPWLEDPEWWVAIEIPDETPVRDRVVEPF